MPVRHYLPVYHQGHFRQICLTEFSSVKSEETILCLPGLLETSAAWHDFANFFAKKHRVFIIDYAGRALSEYLPDGIEYRMSACLADICSAVSFINGFDQRSKKRASSIESTATETCLHLVGNSMGGLLAVTFAAEQPSIVTSLVINDVGAVVPWTGLVAIMGAVYATGIRANDASPAYTFSSVARDLNVDPRLLRAVMRPPYADLDLRHGLQGLSYEKYFAKTKVPTLLIHSTESHMVTEQVLDSTKAHKDMEIFSVSGSQHPVLYTSTVNEKIESFISQENGNADIGGDESNDATLSDWFERFKGKKFL